MKESILIPCSIGVLTYNSGENLHRCLNSVKNFKEIIISDGGSSDSTIDIAKRFNAKIISQSDMGKPILDFSKERNILLNAATNSWFFYLDADEIMSEGLQNEMRDAILKNQHQAYRVRYLKTNEDLAKIYRTYREYYQVRFFRTDIGAYFERAVHERVHLPDSVRIGQIEGPWYVPLDRDDLSIRRFVQKAWGRTKMTADAWIPHGAVDVLNRIFIQPLTLISKSLIKMILVKVKWGNQAIPVKYEFLRIVYSCLLFVRHAQRFFSYLSA